MSLTDYPDWTKNIGVNSGANQVVLLDLPTNSISIPIDAGGNGEYTATIPGSDVPPTTNTPTPAHAVAIVTDILVWNQLITNFRVVDKSTNQAYFQLGESYLLQDYFNEIFPILTASGEIDVIIQVTGAPPNTNYVLTGGLSVIAYTASIPPQPPQSTIRSAINNSLLQGLFAGGALIDPYLNTILNDIAEMTDSIGYPQSNLKSTVKGISVGDSVAPADAAGPYTSIVAAQGVLVGIWTPNTAVILRNVYIRGATPNHEYFLSVGPSYYQVKVTDANGYANFSNLNVYVSNGTEIGLTDDTGASVGNAQAWATTL